MSNNLVAVPPKKQPDCCNFCGKADYEVARLIAGATAHICNECVELCNDIIAQRFVPGELAKRMEARREAAALARQEDHP